MGANSRWMRTRSIEIRAFCASAFGGGGGVSPDSPLVRRIVALLSDGGRLADAKIAERLGRTVTDVRQAAGVPYRQPSRPGSSRAVPGDGRRLHKSARLIPMLD